MTKPTTILDKLLKHFLRRQNREFQKEEEDLEAIAANERKAFLYEILVSSTCSFSSKLGEGNFGPVYKGRLEDGKLVAVKKLGRGSLQDLKEFTNEAMLLSRVQHKNVVNLYGYCIRAEDRFLVYEYVPNESLDKILFAHNIPDNLSQAIGFFAPFSGDSRVCIRLRQTQNQSTASAFTSASHPFPPIC